MEQITITVENKLGKVTTNLYPTEISNLKLEIESKKHDSLFSLRRLERFINNKIVSVYEGERNYYSRQILSIYEEQEIYELMNYIHDSLLTENSLERLHQEILQRLETSDKKQEFKKSMWILVWNHLSCSNKDKNFVFVEGIARQLQGVGNVDYWMNNLIL